MTTMWDREIAELENRLIEVKEYQRLILEAKKEIKIGVIITDTDSGKEMIVTKLKNGSNDFEADPLDKNGIGRGYSYMVRNWKLKA